MTNFVVSNDIEEIRKLIKMGYIPVECSIGGISIVDNLKMDHHGNLSHLEGVAIRAYRDHYGEAKRAAGFVVSGNADADATFAVASLMGIIPHPSNDDPRMRKDLIELAETIDYIDRNGLPADVTKLKHSDIVMTWDAMTSQSRDNIGFATAVGMWRNLLLGNPARLAPFFKAPIEAEKFRHNQALKNLEKAERISDDVLIIRDSEVFGFPEWYAESPVVITLSKEHKSITIGCKDIQKAEELFGEGGLKNVFPKLQPEGWGGREAVGGSPRGMKMTYDDLVNTAKVVVSCINK